MDYNLFNSFCLKIILLNQKLKNNEILSNKDKEILLYLNDIILGFNNYCSQLKNLDSDDTNIDNSTKTQYNAEHNNYFSETINQKNASKQTITNLTEITEEYLEKIDKLIVYNWYVINEPDMKTTSKVDYFVYKK